MGSSFAFPLSLRALGQVDIGKQVLVPELSAWSEAAFPDTGIQIFQLSVHDSLYLWPGSWGWILAGSREKRLIVYCARAYPSLLAQSAPQCQLVALSRRLLPLPSQSYCTLRQYMAGKVETSKSWVLDFRLQQQAQSHISHIFPTGWHKTFLLPYLCFCSPAISQPALINQWPQKCTCCLKIRNNRL